MPSVVGVLIVDSQHHHMRGAGTDLVIATRAPVGLGSPEPRHRADFIVAAIGARLHPARWRQWWRSGPGPSSARCHQNSRNSSLSIPRITS
jgi:hypothetical protein